MGLLTRLLQKAPEAAQAARSVPKREMNPLIKRRAEELAKKIHDATYDKSYKIAKKGTSKSV